MFRVFSGFLATVLLISAGATAEAATYTGYAASDTTGKVFTVTASTQNGAAAAAEALCKRTTGEECSSASNPGGAEVVIIQCSLRGPEYMTFIGVAYEGAEGVAYNDAESEGFPRRQCNVLKRYK